jgi:hypothetical protein
MNIYSILESLDNLEEKWKGDADIKATGEYADKTVAELRKMYNALKKSGPHEAGSEPNTKMKQIAFAIRAKTGFGKVTEAVAPEVEKFMDAVVAAGDEGYEMLADAQIGQYGDAVRKFVENMYANASQEIGGHPDDDQELILDKMMDYIRADFPAKKATSEAMEDDYDGASVEDIASAITQRMMRAKNFGALVREVDILDLNDAIESVAEFHEGGDLGTSDVSNMVRDVLKQLGKQDMKLEDVEVKEAVSLDQAREYFFDKHDFADENIQGEYNKMASKMSPKDAMALKKELEEFYPEALEEQDVEEATPASQQAAMDKAFKNMDQNIDRMKNNPWRGNQKVIGIGPDQAKDGMGKIGSLDSSPRGGSNVYQMKNRSDYDAVKDIETSVADLKFDTDIDEAQVEEGNDFTKARLDAIKAGKDSFEVDGKTYKVTGDTSDEKAMSEDYNKDEYDEEGEMADNQLDVVHDAAQELQDIIDSDDNLPEWVQSKITKAMDYLDTARDYMKSVEDDEEVDADDVEPPVEETTTAGAVATSAGGEGIYKNASVYEGYKSRVDNMITEGMSVNISASDEGEPSVNVNASGEDAMALAQLLQLAAVPPKPMTKKVCKHCGDEQGKPEHMDCPYDCMDPMGENFMEVACEADEANSADNGVTYDMHYLINSISGGLNGPKRQINPNNPGDNPMAMTGIGKDTLNMSQQVSEGEDVKSHLETLYKEFKSK